MVDRSQHLTLVHVGYDPRIFTDQEAAHRAEISNIQLGVAQQRGDIAEVHRTMCERHEEDRVGWEKAFSQPTWSSSCRWHIARCTSAMSPSC